ncbi:hypothetical protein ABH925_005509 [Streptacidiphilus sp. EB129]
MPITIFGGNGTMCAGITPCPTTLPRIART